MLKKIGWPLTIVVLGIVGYHAWSTYGFTRYKNDEPTFSFRVIGGWESEKTQEASGATSIVFSSVIDEKKQEVLRVSYLRNATSMDANQLEGWAKGVTASEYGQEANDDNELVVRTDFDGRPGFIARATGSDRRKRPATVLGIQEGWLFMIKSSREDYVLRASDTFKMGK